MSWSKLLVNKDAQKHSTSKRELDNMRELIARDCSDASLPGLSADRRFATAYNAALQAANMAIACAGYRITAKTGHHAITLESAQLALGISAATLTDYFEVCRRKRNKIDYMQSHVATETEAKEIVKKAKEFYDLVDGLDPKESSQFRKMSSGQLPCGAQKFHPSHAAVRSRLYS